MWVRTSRRAPARRPCSPASSGRQVPARALALGARERGLDQQQVGVLREGAQGVAGRGVGAVGERRPSPATETAWVGQEVRDGLEAYLEHADADRRARVVLLEREGVSMCSSRMPAAAHRRRNASRAPGGAISRGRGGSSVPGLAVDRHRLVARRVGEARGEGHEVQDVVGVQVRDHDRVDLP